MLDYEILRLIWWVLLGVLLIGFALTDGFDLGVGMLLPWVAKNDMERRVVINTVGPVWEGNQVWIVLGAGAIFAAWPPVYGAAFSGFYYAMLLTLSGFIMRPVGFKYRSKLASPRWRSIWDITLFLGGLIPSLIFGVAVGNALVGVPFYFDESLRFFYQGSFFELLNPFALLCGLLSVAMLAMHGGLYLAIKTEGRIHDRAVIAVRTAALLVVLLFSLGGYFINSMDGYAIVNAIDPNGPSNPLHKTVTQVAGVWMKNYTIYPWMWSAPIAGFLGALGAFLFSNRRLPILAFINSGFSIAGIIATVGFSMFPFILPSSSQPSVSLTVWDASSSQFTLMIMLVCAIIFVPIILLYTSWVYRVMKGKVTESDIVANQESMY